MLFDSIGMCFERIRMHSGSILMYFNRMQKCCKSYCILQAYMFIQKASECFLKSYECNLKVYEYFWRAYECIWNVCNYRYISSFNVIRTHKAAMTFHNKSILRRRTNKARKEREKSSQGAQLRPVSKTRKARMRARHEGSKARKARRCVRHVN